MIRLGVVILSLAAAPYCRAETRRLGTEAPFSAVSGLLQPGDEVVLAPGRHASLRVDNLHGTAAKPIVVRGEGMDRPGLIAAGEVGIEVVGCTNVVFEDLVVHSASSVGVLVRPADETTPPRESTGIVLRRVVVLGQDSAPSTGVRVTASRDVRVEQCRIERCVVAGVDLDGAVAPRIADLLLGGTQAASRCGVLVRGATENALVANVAVVGGIRCGAVLGANVMAAPPARTPGAAAPESPPPPSTSRPTSDLPEPLTFAATEATPRSIRLDQCNFGRCEASLVIGNVAGAVVERCTFHLPKGPFVVVIDPAPAGRVESPAILRRNLFAWLPNQIQRLASLPAGFAEGSVRLEENLWWAEDFQPLRAQYGPFPGTVAAPQTTDIDPKVDRDGRPANEAAAGFGSG